MVIETTDGSRFQLLPEGHYTFKIIGVPGKFATAKSHYRKWVMSYMKNDMIETVTFIIFPWDSIELLEAIGGMKQPNGNVIWNDEKVDGKTIETDVVHEPDNNGTLRQKLRNVKEGLPF